MKIPLEDDFNDVISKAQAGWKISISELSDKSGQPIGAIQLVRKGKFDETVVRAICPVLKLDTERVISLAKEAWFPQAQTVPGLQQFNSPFPIPSYAEMTVNAYLAFDPASKATAIFDTGANIAEMLAFIQENQLVVRYILITHTHPDHIKKLHQLVQNFPEAKVYSHKNEPIANATAIDAGHAFELGALNINTLKTSGHSPGGVSYSITGLEKPVAIVGDALFAGSMGGSPANWQEALNNNIANLFSLPPATVVCPGHGPMTTIAEEQAHNPFFK